MRLKNGKTGQNEEYVILGPWESNPSRNVISYLSPLGMALWDHRAGEELKFTINQNEFHYSRGVHREGGPEKPMRTRTAPRRQPRGPASLCALLAGSAAPAAAANIDLVVMVDTSESMFPYFDDLMNYLVQNLLTEKLHKGDTFHLLSFSSVPEVEISLEVNSEEAAQRAFGRILLLHALGRYTDLVSALQFLSKYAKELPETNPKQIILITDGVNDPPPGSPNRGTPEAVARPSMTRRRV